MYVAPIGATLENLCYAQCDDWDRIAILQRSTARHKQLVYSPYCTVHAGAEEALARGHPEAEGSMLLIALCWATHNSIRCALAGVTGHRVDP